MASDLELALRGPEAYALSRKAMADMERLSVWPTPLNYELFINAVGDPGGPLARALAELTAAGEPITETVSEQLAAEFLTRGRLTDQIRDAGDQLNRELESVSKAIRAAHQSSQAYGLTLAGASEQLAGETEGPVLQRMVEELSAATHRIGHENSSLEQQLSASTQEVERLREHLEQVRRDAMTDSLTNLANRKSFDEALARLCAVADEAPISLAVIDIDHFKRFNDTWGHQTGDQVLRYVASVIARLGGDPRIAARYGGEEFSIVFPGETVQAVLPLLDQIRAEIGSRILKRRSTNEELGTVTISAGVAQRLRGEDPMALIERADAALYASKRGGRDRVSAAGLASAA